MSVALDRMQAVEPRSDAVLRPMVEQALATTDVDGREARRTMASILAAAVGAGPVPSGFGAGAPDADVAAALVEVMPATVAWLVARGMSEPDAWRSMADVPRKIATYGVRGTGADWLATVATGSVVTVGRLQFERPGEAPGRPPGHPAGAQAWGVHIPELGPLDPDACDAAFTVAPAVLERLWDVDAGWWTCDSWVLDPRLVDVLGPDANLVQFAERFTLLSEAPASDGSTSADGPAASGESAATHGDASLAKFVFGTSVADMRTVEPVGRLQSGLRAVLDAGGHWTERVGIAPVPRRQPADDVPRLVV